MEWSNVGVNNASSVLITRSPIWKEWVYIIRTGCCSRSATSKVTWEGPGQDRFMHYYPADSVEEAKQAVWEHYKSMLKMGFIDENALD